MERRGPIVGIVLREPVRAYTLFFPIRLREVLVSVDPEAFIAALSPS